MLQEHIRYSKWSSGQLVHAASKLTSEELVKDFKTSDRSVLGTLVHTFAADRIWLWRVEGKVPEVFFDPDRDMRLEVLQNDWPALYDRWYETLARLSPDTIINYKDLKGNAHNSSVQQIVLHLVNHGTHHRGQVSGFLRAMGHTPPVIDLIRFYREGL